MSSYDDKLSAYYDLMFSGKDYGLECDLINSFCERKGKLLDVGCGTLTHTVLLSKNFNQIVAVDLSEKMIEAGKVKLRSLGIDNVTTLNCDVSDIKNEGNFDAAIAMFNVVNHIDRTSKLLKFFRSISNLLSTDGLLMFDCWNGVASIKDEPREFSEKTLTLGQLQLRISTTTKTDLMRSKACMTTSVAVNDNEKEIDSFSYSLSHKLWTPGDIYDMIEESGMKVDKVIPSFDSSRDASPGDHRITFICRKAK